MADYKQYIQQVYDNGTLQISEDVLSDIVEVSLREVDGIVLSQPKTGNDLAEMFVKKALGMGHKVTIHSDGSVVVDCTVSVAYGQSVIQVAKAAQNSIVSRIVCMTGVTDVTVNVNVGGIVKL